MQVLPGGCCVFTPGEGEAVTEGTWTHRTLICRKNGARDIEETIHEYSPGRSPLLVEPQAEQVLYVIRGQGVCSIAGFEYELQPGIGCYIPANDPYRVENRGPEKLVLIGVCSPEGAQRHAVEETQLRSRAGSEAPRRVIREQDRRPIPTANRRFKLLVNRDLGCKRITQFIGFIPPSKAPFHYHTYEEAVFVLEGSGILHTEGGSCEFGPGTSIYLPPGVRHCLENPGPTPVGLLGAF